MGAEVGDKGWLYLKFDGMWVCACVFLREQKVKAVHLKARELLGGRNGGV